MSAGAWIVHVGGGSLDIALDDSIEFVVRIPLASEAEFEAATAEGLARASRHAAGDFADADPAYRAPITTGALGELGAIIGHFRVLRRMATFFVAEDDLAIVREVAGRRAS